MLAPQASKIHPNRTARSMTLVQKAVIFFTCHLLGSLGLILARKSIPYGLQCVFMPGILLLRPMSQVARKFGLDSSLPVAFACGGICILLGSGLWTALFVWFMRSGRP